MNHEQWLSWWQARAATYFTDKAFNFSRPDLIKKLKLPPHPRILEIGYGYGRELSQWCKMGGNVWGVELSSETRELAIRELRKKGIAEKQLPNLVEYDGETLPFPDDSFDVVYSCFVMQHLSRDHARKIFSESLRVSRLRGHVVHEFFGDPQYWDSGKDVFSGDPDNGGMFNNSWTREEILDMVESLGVLDWFFPHPITLEWGNFWVCAGKLE
jgi:ubiquinone/menaquinone biosynthesis C-methylase UbiE